MKNNNEYLNKFPKLELFYDKILHNKVYSDLYILIPNGTKVFIWITYNKGENICLLLFLNKYNLIINVKEIALIYNSKLSYGTILYGTYFEYEKIKYVTCENIFYYKGKYINNDSNFLNKYKILKEIFDNEVKQIIYNSQFIILGLPVIKTNLKEAFNTISKLPYSIQGVLCVNWNMNKSEGIILNKLNKNSQNNKEIETIFKVKADIQPDIYYLFCQDKNNKNNKFHSIACIPDYKTSVKMNSLFRKIKENYILDLLEESDNEEEFEDIREDKYVNLKKILYMKCTYISKFRKWKPIEIVDFGKELLKQEKIYELEKKIEKKIFPK